MADPSLCACGSGLRKLRCCALDLAGRSPRDPSQPLQTLMDQAEALADHDSVAIGLCCRVLELAFGQERALALPEAPDAILLANLAWNPKAQGGWPRPGSSTGGRWR